MSAPTFYTRHAAAVQARTQGTPIYASVVLSQLGLESGDGKSLLATKYNNYGGHKASAKWKGPTVRFKTPHDGQKVSTFRVYKSFDECLIAHVALLQNPIYKPAQQAPSAYAQAYALAHTYAEDASYATKLTNLMRQYDLTQYDPAGSGLLVLGLLVAAGAAYRYRTDLAGLFKSS